jgi:hypothetical protein
MLEARTRRTVRDTENAVISVLPKDGGAGERLRAWTRVSDRGSIGFYRFAGRRRMSEKCWFFADWIGPKEPA